MLGPGALTTHLADLGADVIKVEPPQGDYVRQMTWPIVEGVSLMHLHVNRGKRSVVLDLRTEEGGEIFLELVRDADAVVEAMRPGGLARRGLGFEQLREVNPKIVFCTISGYGMTGPYRDMPSHGIAYDTWAGIVQPDDRRRRLRVHPRARVDRHQRRPAVRRARVCSPASCRRARPARAASSRSRSPTPPPRSTGCAARRGRRTSGPSPRSPATRPTTTSGARPAPPAWETASATSSTRSKDGHVLFMASEQEFWKNFCEGVDRLELFERWPGSQYADHARGNRELRATCATSSRTKTSRRVDRVRRRAQHADRAGEHAARRCRRPAVPGPAPVDPRVAPRRRQLPTRSSSSARRCRSRRRPRPSASTPTRCCARRSAGRRPDRRRARRVRYRIRMTRSWSAASGPRSGDRGRHLDHHRGRYRCRCLSCAGSRGWKYAACPAAIATRTLLAPTPSPRRRRRRRAARSRRRAHRCRRPRRSGPRRRARARCPIRAARWSRPVCGRSRSCARRFRRRGGSASRSRAHCGRDGRTPDMKKHRWERQGRAAIPGVPLPVLQGVRARRAGGAPRNRAEKYPRFLGRQTCGGQEIPGSPPDALPKHHRSPCPRPTGSSPNRADRLSGVALPRPGNALPATLRADPGAGPPSGRDPVA